MKNVPDAPRVGPPRHVEIERDGEGLVSFQMYDDNGLSCGGADFCPNGVVVWSLLQGDVVQCGRDDPCASA